MRLSPLPPRKIVEKSQYTVFWMSQFDSNIKSQSKKTTWQQKHMILCNNRHTGWCNDTQTGECGDATSKLPLPVYKLLLLSPHLLQYHRMMVWLCSSFRLLRTYFLLSPYVLAFVAPPDMKLSAVPNLHHTVLFITKLPKQFSLKAIKGRMPFGCRH